jgi:hypothetical protein
MVMVMVMVMTTMLVVVLSGANKRKEIATYIIKNELKE